MPFADVNKMNKRLAKQNITNNIAVLVKNGQEKFKNLKPHGSNVANLYLDDTDYYQKYDITDHQKFNELVQVGKT